MFFSFSSLLFSRSARAARKAHRWLCSRISLRLFMGGGGAFVRRVVSEKPELVGSWVKTWFCLVCLLLLEGGGARFL